MPSRNIIEIENLHKSYSGFKALNNIVIRQPELLETVTIIDEQKRTYEVSEFLDLITKWKIMS